jgi:hypothetical protein
MSGVTVAVHEPDDELHRVLLDLQRAVLHHPVAAQALFASLVAEGRRFVDTAEGAAWRDRLRGTDLVHRTRVVWDVTTMRMLEDDPDTLLPSAVVDALVQAARRDDLEPFLSRLFELNHFARRTDRARPA